MRIRIVSILVLAGLLMASVRNLRADDESIFDRIRLEHAGIEKASCRVCGNAPGSNSGLLPRAQQPSLQPLDVKHYRLQIGLNPDGAVVSGRVTVTAEATAVVSSIDLDSGDNLTIDSAGSEGGTTETRVVVNDARKQKVTFTVPKPPASVVVDENHWVLKKVKGV